MTPAPAPLNTGGKIQAPAKGIQKSGTKITASSSSPSPASPAAEISSVQFQPPRTAGALGAALLSANASDSAAPLQNNGGLTDPAALLATTSGDRITVTPTDHLITARVTPAAGHALPVEKIAVEMARNLRQGVTRFEIRIDPPELGRIDIRMKISQDGRMQAVLTSDRPETLDLLQRDARLLSQSLVESGLDVDQGALQFSLRQDFGQSTSGQGETALSAGAASQNGDDTPSSVLSVTISPGETTYGFRTIPRTSVNVQI